jgi:hypothetical protein
MQSNRVPSVFATLQKAIMTDIAEITAKSAAKSVAKTTAAKPDLSWAIAMDKATEDEGFFYSIGAQHFAFFADAGTTLLVSFETKASVLAQPDQLPLAHSFAKDKGWSVLTLIADGDTWFRDPAVYAFFDRQVDDAFFEDFDQVLFYGAGMGAYAACAYSVAAPGATVLALNPRATLNPAQTAWDTRNNKARRLDFTSRYGYAPDMLDGAARAFVIHDPTVPAESMQAALFHSPHITRLSARHMGDTLEKPLTNLKILPELIDQAMQGTLTTQSFASLRRMRRNFAPYLRNLIAKADQSERMGHVKMICRSVVKRLNAPRYAERLSQILADEAAAKNHPA